MTPTLTNYDGSIVASPQQLVSPASVEELQAILKDTSRFPSPVRAVGSFHSLTPCATSSGTMVDMSRFKRILNIDAQQMTFTAQAGLQLIEAADILRRLGLQFMLNIEIGNITLGSAACCQTKDSLDGVEYGQISSYVTRMKWVNPAGSLEEASEERDQDLLFLMRSSYGLAGIVYEVSLRIKPLEILRLNYSVYSVDSLSQQAVSAIIDSNDSMVCWTTGRSVVVQTRNRAERLHKPWLGTARRLTWMHTAAFIGRSLYRSRSPSPFNERARDLWMLLQGLTYRGLSASGGFSIYAPDKIMNYDKTPRFARYAFSFWAFPRDAWVSNLQSYLEFSEDHFQRHGFRCNLPLGSYFIRLDTSGILSYSHDGDVISLDPIHAFSAADQQAWEYFLHQFNEWAQQRRGIPLLNQSPFVTKEQVLTAYGDRWARFSACIRSADPERRMLNPFFEELLV
jgi:FAD/FMN-containing dehydrogenase